MIAFVVGFTIINLSLWAVLLIKFKKIFSADSIIEKYRGIMNKMVADLNRNAEYDINLSKEASKRMKQMLNEADKTMENFREATDRLRNMIAEADKYSQENIEEPVVTVNLKQFSNTTDEIFDRQKNFSNNSTGFSNNNVDQYKINAYKSPNNSVNENDIDPNAAYELKIQSNSPQNKKTLLKDETILTTQGAAYKEVPVLTTKLSDEIKNGYNINTKETLNEKVQRLFNKGLTAQEIAAKLSCSITEVQLIIELIS